MNRRRFERELVEEMEDRGARHVDRLPGILREAGTQDPRVIPTAHAAGLLVFTVTAAAAAVLPAVLAMGRNPVDALRHS